MQLLRAKSEHLDACDEIVSEIVSEIVRPRRAALVIHSFAAHSSFQGPGYGDALLRSCEAYAVRNGYASIRLDVCSGNAAALRFYERHGYVYCGGVRFAFKPAGHQQYRCYDKKVG